MKTYLRPNKTVLLAFIVLLFIANSNAQKGVSQECSKYISSGFDEVTGEAITKSTPQTLLNKSSNKELIINWRYNSKTEKATLLIKPINAGYCVDKDSPIFFLFKDGTKLVLKNQSNFNCDDKIEVFFEEMFHEEKGFKFLKTKKVALIRVTTSTSNAEYNLNDSQATEFMNTAKCISENDLKVKINNK